ncbi:hypothetical protein M231_05587 [Tremella mesenterica]|uniref:DDHD domain-containing protein n=1 Tax=Tremella mesenterica TaxID=5217 RepID=A0A4Q1BHP0_TREME|nr:hypothetical protein M231_05587 [Tremella mesenterica]
MSDLAPRPIVTSPTLPAPPLDARWVHAGAQYLDLLPTPITSASTSYKAFSPSESKRIEARWTSLPLLGRQLAIKEWGAAEGEGASKVKKEHGRTESTASNNDERRSSSKDREKDRGVPDAEVIRSGEEQPTEGEVDGEGRYRNIMADAQKEYENLELIAGVPVSQDSLFEVDLKTLSLHPVFWAHTGPRVSVMRGTWFVTDETRPCSWDLGEEIERGYLEIKPWLPSYKDELAAATALGPAAEEKLKYALPIRFGPGLGVIFEDGEKGRLLSSGALNYLSRAFWSTLRTKPSGTYVYRGYKAAKMAKDDKSSISRRGSNASVRSQEKSSRPASVIDDKLQPEIGKGNRTGRTDAPERSSQDDDEKKGQSSTDSAVSDAKTAMREEREPIVDADDNDTPCTDLCLVIHGIGQQLATQYESYNFVYAGNQLRQVLRKQAANPALASIIRDRRIQVLPVQWRALLDLEAEKTAEDQEHEMDNRFTMNDITINKSIPYVRELTNAVLLDIPLFMSHHRSKMIEAVCLQANRLYRLWIARNPDFEKNGRVHIIGHSLGSALAAHILSNQSTKMPHLSQLPKQVITQTRNRFLFNTSGFFLVGSPLGVFLHLDQAQIMPRKGRERTMHSPQDEALDRAGKFGCMAVDSIYNIFYLNDPIAYTLNAAVDVNLARERKPLAITSVTAPFYTTVTDGLSRYLPAIIGGGGERKLLRPGTIRLPSGIEMSGPTGEERLKGSRGERRFSALNPHGNLDFYLASAGMSEYLDMITAHASYWTDPSFAAFLLAEVFSTKWDLIRTGMGLAEQVLPPGTSI